MITRRFFIKTLAVFSLSMTHNPGNVFALDKKERSLTLNNIHTGEKLDIKYYSSGAYDHDAINELNKLFRCHYTNEIKPIDIRVINLLCDIKDIISKDREILIISGYRSPAYNEHLRRIGRGVVQNSLHLQGRAIDFRIPPIDNGKLVASAKSFYAGGVGKYPDFVHIDTGRIRYW